MALPIGPLTFDATIKIGAAPAADSEFRHVEGELATTAVATPPTQPKPNPRVILVARHIFGPNYRQPVHGIDFH